MNFPSYLENYTEDVRKKWAELYVQYENEGPEIASIAANTWLKRHLETHKRNPESLAKLKFEVDTSEGFIKRSENGDVYLSAVLQDTNPDRDGVTYTPEVLQKWAEAINADLPGGDADHSLYDKLLASGVSDDFIKRALKEKKGIAKAVKAVFDKGKLWLRILIDKRYQNIIQKSKGLSLEAFVSKDPTNKVVDGELLGWSFILNGSPAIANPVMEYG